LPNAIPNLCIEPGCNHRTTTGNRCAAHRKQHKGLGQQAPYNTRWWRRVRAVVLSEQPLCAACNTQPATQCDHIKPLDVGGTNERDNLQGLCAACHTRKTFSENRGKEHSPCA